MQERAADKQSELDELRARRYQESKDREWRNKERAQAERQAAMQRELTEARAAQKNATIRQQADMARVEHEDFMRVLAVNRAKEHSDMTLVRPERAKFLSLFHIIIFITIVSSLLNDHLIDTGY